MKLTTKQAKELKVLRYWIPGNWKHQHITQKQISDFFAWSDRGVAHNRNVISDNDGFTALYWAKNRRDLQIQSYLEDWGFTMNAWSFSEMPNYIREDIAKRMRKPAILEVG